MADQQSSGRGQVRRVFVFVMSLFFISFFETGVLKSFSVLVNDLVFQFDTNLGTIGTIFGIYHGITYFLAPFIAPFVNIMSVSLISFICAVGSLTLSIACVASDVIQFGAVCLLSGVCYSVVRLAGVILFYRNVRENFSITFGIADAGNAIGMMVVPILTEFLLETYGWSGVILLLGGLLFQNSIFLLLMKDRHRESYDDNSDFQEGGARSSSSVDSEVDDDVFDEDDDLLQRRHVAGGTTSSTSIGLWRCCHGVYTYFGLSVFFECRHTAVVMLYMVLSGIINASWLVFLIPHGASRGYYLSQAVFLATCGGFGNVLGRVVQGPIVDRKWMSSLDLTIIFTIINAVVFLFDPLILNFVLLALAAFLGGLAIGARTTLTVVIAKEFFPSDSFSLIYGLQSLFYSLGEPLGGLMAGWLASRVSFSVSFTVLGAIEVLICLVLIPTRYLISRYTA